MPNNSVPVGNTIPIADDSGTYCGPQYRPGAKTNDDCSVIWTLGCAINEAYFVSDAAGMSTRNIRR